MGRKRLKTIYRRTVLRLSDLDNAKSAVLNSLTSSSSRRVYEHAIEEFIAWYCSEPRLAFNRIVWFVIAFTWRLAPWRQRPSISVLQRFVGWPMRRQILGC